MSHLMTGSVAAWKEDGGAGLPRTGISVVLCGCQARTSIASPPVKESIVTAIGATLACRDEHAQPDYFTISDSHRGGCHV